LDAIAFKIRDSTSRKCRPQRWHAAATAAWTALASSASSTIGSAPSAQAPGFAPERRVAVIDEIDEPESTLLEFERLGAEIWQRIDAQQYVNELRDEWNRP